MSNENPKLNRLKELLKLLDESLTRKDFEAAFKAILEQILTLEKRLIEKINTLSDSVSSSFKTFSNKLETKVNSELSIALKKIDDRDSRITKQQEDGLLFIKDKIKDFQREIESQKVDKEELLREAISRSVSSIKIPEPMEETANTILDKIEGLIEIKYIKGLEKEIEELKKLRRLGGGGGFSAIAMLQHFINDESPVNSGNNINFTIAHNPSPVNSLKFYRGGARQRITEDFTFSGRTITLINPFTTGEVLLVDYMI